MDSLLDITHYQPAERPSPPFLKENRFRGRIGDPVKITASVDTGSNSLRFVAYTVVDGRLEEIKKSNLKAEPALGKGMEEESGVLNPDAEPEALKFFFHCGQYIVNLEVDAGFVIGTSALRHASDSHIFIAHAQNAAAWGMAYAKNECTEEEAIRYITSNQIHPNDSYRLEFTIVNKRQESILTGLAALFSNPEANGTVLGIGGKSGHGCRIQNGLIVPGSFAELPIGHIWLRDHAKTGTADEAYGVTLGYLEKHCHALKNPHGAIYPGGGAFRLALRLLAIRANRATIMTRYSNGITYELRTNRIKEAFLEIGDPEYSKKLHDDAVQGLRPQELEIWEKDWHLKIGHRAEYIPQAVGALRAYADFSEADRMICYRDGIVEGIQVEAGYAKIRNGHSAYSMT